MSQNWCWWFLGEVLEAFLLMRPTSKELLRV